MYYIQCYKRGMGFNLFIKQIGLTSNFWLHSPLNERNETSQWNYKPFTSILFVSYKLYLTYRYMMK